MENMDKNFMDIATSNFSLPHDVIQLPTGGIFYKNKQKTVKVGYLTANDENLIATVNQQRIKENVIVSLLRSKIYEPGMKLNELLEEDIQAILLFLRNSSFGPEYKVKLTDPVSGKDFEASVILDELNITRPTNAPSADGTFNVTLPKTNAQVKIRPLSFMEINELDDLVDSYPQGRVAPIVTWKLNKQIVELNGSSDKQAISTFVEQLPIIDSKYIKNFLKENVPALDLKREVIAPSGEKVSFNIAFGVDFFRPFF